MHFSRNCLYGAFFFFFFFPPTLVPCLPLLFLPESCEQWRLACSAGKFLKTYYEQGRNLNVTPELQRVSFSVGLMNLALQVVFTNTLKKKLLWTCSITVQFMTNLGCQLREAFLTLAMVPKAQAHLDNLPRNYLPMRFSWHSWASLSDLYEIVGGLHCVFWPPVLIDIIFAISNGCFAVDNPGAVNILPAT